MGRESAPSASVDEPRMRVRVCMRRFFADERARAVVLVPVARRVRWLRRRLRALFPLPPRVELLAGRHLLPPDEPLALLARDELVEVIPRGTKAVEIGLFDPREHSSEVLDAKESPTRDRSTSPPGCARGATHLCAAAPHASGAACQAGDALVCVVNGSTHESSDERVFDRGAPVAGPCPASGDADELHHSKLRALELLARHCAAGEQSPSEASPRARRRRVRRRRRAPSASGGDAPGAQSAERDAGEYGTLSNGAGDGAAAGVVRSGAQARAPRMVRALSPAASFDTDPAASVDDAIMQ